jgi:hypothetical protein
MIPAEVRDFSLPHIIQAISEVHPASYPVGTADSFHEDNAVEA